MSAVHGMKIEKGGLSSTSGGAVRTEGAEQEGGRSRTCDEVEMRFENLTETDRESLARLTHMLNT
jgi:hypothetical protein